MRARNILTLVVAVALFAPVATAGHWSLYYSGHDPGIGETNEPDGVTFDDPARGLEGRGHRVTPIGREPGDGSLFLDGRLGSVTFLGPTVYPGPLTADTTGRDDIILPGQIEFSAWYGQWLDTDLDRAIDDVHDSQDDGADEFVWQGIGNGVETTVAVMYSSGAVGWARTYAIVKELTDQTDREGSEQGWRGGGFLSFDNGFIASFHVLTLAGARALPGTSLKYDVDDPSALIDVDRYSAVSPIVESLYLASGPAPGELDRQYVNPIREAYWPGIPDMQPILDAYSGVRDAALELLEVADDAPSFDEVQNMPRAPYGKEPTTQHDDYGGLALADSAFDLWGTRNRYDAYRDAYHFYFDMTARGDPCAGAVVSVPGTSVTADPGSQCLGSVYALDPAGSIGPGKRTAGTWLSFRAHALLWKDKNADTHLGVVCDPEDPAEFDPFANTCDPRLHPQPWPHRLQNVHLPTLPNSEVVDVCPLAHVRGTAITLTPVGGPWPRVVVHRDIRETNRLLDPGTLEIREDAAPITLRWNTECRPTSASSAGYVDARDAVIFPAGAAMAVGVLVTTESRIDRFHEPILGIDITGERIVDVDYLPPAL